MKTPFVLIPALLTSAALAQEAMYTAAATMPGPGIMVFRQQVHAYRFGTSTTQGVEHVSLLQLDNALQIGLGNEQSITLNAPLEWSSERSLTGTKDSDFALSQVDAMYKWRFYRDDSGGIDTTRAALLLGLRADTEKSGPTDGFNLDPHLGVVYTRVHGRHGWNAELHYTFATGGTDDRADNFNGGTGSADALRANLAYVYRIIPDAYTADSTGAWYLTAELNFLYETNGDHDLRFSPGLMYEGRRFGFEIMAQIPVTSHLDHRPELDWAIGIGWRLIF